MSISPRSGRVRTLSASSRARRERLQAAKHRRRLMGGGAALAVLIAAPLAITAYMGVDPGFPGIDAAKSFMALLEDRSPGDRTAAELTKTKKKAAPEQRALGKITKPETPPEFEEALAPPAPVIETPPFPVALAGLGPLVESPAPPPGGGGFITTGTGGGGGGGGGTENPPPENPPPENPPPENPPPENPPPVVPEPATWASMLLGFGITGLVMRRRRRRDTAVSWA